ncbi:MAG: hypothetical protein ABTQ31_17265 [Rhizobiaceae bacterium]
MNKQAEPEAAFGDINDPTILTDALTSRNPIARMTGRGVASGWPDTLRAWIEAELNAPKSEPSDVLYALARLQVQIFASVAAQLGPADVMADIVKLYQAVVAKEMPVHAARCAQAMAEIRQRGRA